MKRKISSTTVTVKVEHKERVMWTINPVTRTTRNPRAYDRSSAKRAARKELREY